jgi:hypothetical protein
VPCRPGIAGAGVQVTLHGRWAEDFCEAPLSRAFPQFNLKESILGSDETLGKEQIVLIACIDMGDSPAVALHTHAMVQARHLVGAADDGEAGGGALLPVGIGGSCERSNDNGGSDDHKGQSPIRGGHPPRV